MEGLKLSKEGPVKGVIKAIVYLGNLSEYYIYTEYREMVKVLPPFDKSFVEGKGSFIEVISEIAKIIPES